MYLSAASFRIFMDLSGPSNIIPLSGDELLSVIKSMGTFVQFQRNSLVMGLLPSTHAMCIKVTKIKRSFFAHILEFTCLVG